MMKKIYQWRYKPTITKNETYELKLYVFYQRPFSHQIILKLVSADVQGNDNKNGSLILKKTVSYEKSFSYKPILKLVSLVVHRNNF